ncbi:MAG: sulfatase-like hydrolase/transferase [Verrucomicrobiota bacterium]
MISHGSQRTGPTIVNVVAAFLLLIAGLAAEPRPNVLLILTDNQSFHELSCHGSPHVKTPRIDALAKEGIDFLNFHAPPFCSPSRAAMLTGRYAMRAGIHNTIGGVSILHRKEKTVADHLKAAGYRTGVFGKWHLGYSYPYLPQWRGFDEVFVHGGGGIGQLEDFFGNNHLDATFLHNGTFKPTEGFSTDVLFQQGMDFIEKNRDAPFFCYVTTPATHRPWQAHPEAAERILARGQKPSANELALYSMIENIDDNVGRILDQLERLDLARRTLVIVATDQGTRRERVHKNLAYDEFHQVFCMMRYPEFTDENAHRSTALCGMVDIAPTILDLCGVKPASAKTDGRSLLPILQGRRAWADERALIVQCPRGRERARWKNAAVKTQRWRYLEGQKLFDVAKDPGQTEDVAANHPVVREKLGRLYDRFWNSLPPAEDLRSYHVLGSEEAPEVRLNAMDWYKGKAPWHQLHMPKFTGNGTWPVEVEKDGRYRFELRYHPREAPQKLGASSASLTIGKTMVENELDDEAEYAVFEVRLKKGRYDLVTALTPGQGSRHKAPWGALFVYISRLAEND